MDKLFVLRKVPSAKSLFLTFDDGPDPEHTPRILDLLKEYGFSATFFVVGEKAQKYPKLIERFLNEGHTVGDHSLNHSYREYFRTKAKTKDWIEKSQVLLHKLIGQAPVGFRPPAGVQTPRLRRVLQEMGIPLILWNQRFFDTVFGLSAKRATKIAGRLKAGDIVLLHDRSSEGIEELLKGLKQRGLKSSALTY